MNLDKKQKIQQIANLLTNGLIPHISLLVRAGLLDKRTAKDILQIDEIEKLVKETKNEFN